MPTVRRYRGRVAGQATLSLGAIAFLRDDEYDPGLGDALWPGNEHAWLLDHDDQPYVLNGDAARKVSGQSARELVEKFGDAYLAEYVKDHPGEKPRWFFRFRDVDGE
jgi:hypothetical protein